LSTNPATPRRNTARDVRARVANLPERSALIAFLGRTGAPVSFDQVARAHALRTPAEQEALQRRLSAMERDGQIIRNRGGAFGLVDRMDLITGRVIGHRDGYGFVRPDDGSVDLFFSPRQMRSLMHGDRVVARVAKIDRNGRREGTLVEVIERGVGRVVGRLWRESGVTFVRPHNARIHHDLLVPPDASAAGRDGDYVVARITEPPTRRHPPIGVVEEVLGSRMLPGMEIDVAIRTYELPVAWSEDVVAEAKALPAKVRRIDVEGREDLRELGFVTIDGEDARDFDDAVYCERTARGWRVVVAIADVSAYVHPASALDDEARLRGNSVYFPDRVVPMLPESISNGLCSLRPHEDRLCVGCELIVAESGRVHRSRFFEGVIRSRARLTYTEVSSALEGGVATLRGTLAEQAPMLDALREAYDALRRARVGRGAIDFDMTETRVVLGPDGRVERLEPADRNVAHRIIEECMVAANVAAARFLERHRLPALFRNHEGPSPEKAQELRAFLEEFGMKLGGGDSPEPRHFAAVIDSASSRPDAHLIQTVMLRSLSQAVYAPANVGHFGLAHRAYIHFTSPIRRYPDIVVHRAIRHVLRRGRLGDFEPVCDNSLSMLGEHCSMTERRADEATRDAIAWLKCEFMLEKLGEVFDATVSGVAPFGVFVTLDDIFVEGLVHVSTLGSDYFHFDPIRHRLRGERSRRSYRLADRMRVRAASVDLDERRIEFEPEGREYSRRKSGSRRASTSRVHGRGERNSRRR
jgi:ribonuclease R